MNKINSIKFTDEDIEILQDMIEKAEKTKTIEYFDDDTFMLSEMQDLIGSEGSSAARVRKHREKHKMLQSNVPVTNGNFPVTNLLRRERDRYRDR